MKLEVPHDLRETADSLGGVNQKVANYYGVHRDTSRKWLKGIGYEYNKNNPHVINGNLETTLRKLYESITA